MTKQEIEEPPTNDPPQVVDGWERLYVNVKSALSSFSSSASTLYLTARSGAESFENRLLLPLRDYLILPLFYSGERLVGFVFSKRMEDAASWALVKIEEHGPFGVGRVFVVPALRASAGVARASFLVMQYPIPSPSTVARVTTRAVEGAKGVLGKAGGEVHFYLKVVDVQVTRALARARWNVLGFGTYAGLSEPQRREVVGHVCERYAGTERAVGRYEFMSVLRMVNPRLHCDLVGGGLLRRRGGERCKDDCWLDAVPAWRTVGGDEDEVRNGNVGKLARICKDDDHFRGRRMPFDEADRRNLESHDKGRGWGSSSASRSSSSDNLAGNAPHGPSPPPPSAADPTSRLSKWYEPSASRDVFVDAGRHCVTLSSSLPRVLASSPQGAPRGLMMRPVFWRYYGDGEPVRGPIDGEDMLVQFRGLESVMAVKKTLGGALSLWKKRVYRGAEVVVGREEGGKGGKGGEREGCNTMEGYNMFVEEFGGGKEEVVEEGEGGEGEEIVKTSLAAPSSLSSSYQYSPSTDPSNDKIDHLVLIVHGIGKALQAFELLGLVHLSSIVDCCAWMRDNHASVASEQRSARAG
ncbi:hypothetical protein TrRE_jg7207, partial [Triparma retinervis]